MEKESGLEEEGREWGRHSPKINAVSWQARIDVVKSARLTVQKLSRGGGCFYFSWKF